MMDSCDCMRPRGKIRFRDAFSPSPMAERHHEMASGTVVGGIHRVPGDKSITHRALLLSALATGQSRIRGALTALDARTTARVLRQLGAGISPLRAGAAVTVTGRGAWRAPRDVLDCGNSGTTTRLLLGLLAAQPIRATLTGDGSLRRRPMRRVTQPLRQMGAVIDDGGHDGLPLSIRGGQLEPLRWTLPVASAQIKSALLLAGAAGGVEVELRQPAPSRDHTERLLRYLQFDVSTGGDVIRLRPTGRFTPLAVDVPGDPSSAIFLLAAALLARRGRIAIAGVGLNPTRTGYLSVLAAMGGDVAVTDPDEQGGEPRGTMMAAPSSLEAVAVSAAESAAIIDEIPMLACLAARARGESRFAGLAELRVKESDRLALLATNLNAIGASAAIEGDDLVVAGGDRPLAGSVVTAGDHRIAMAFAVLGTQPRARIVVDNPACAAVSFPGFGPALAGLFQGRS